MAEEKSGNILLDDNKGIFFGDDADASITYLADTDTLWFNATTISGLEHTHTMDDIVGEVGPEDLATLSGVLHDEIVSASGVLQTQLDNLDFTYATDEILAQVSGSLQDTIDGLTPDHSQLTNLDYANANHTGFQPAGDYATNSGVASISGSLHQEIINIDLSPYATISGVNTVSGVLQDSIDNIDLSGYYTKSEVDTISGTIVTQMPSPIEEGITSITNNTDEVDITFSAPQLNTNYVVNATIQNTIDAEPSKYVYTVSAKSLAGFTLSLSSPVDSGNYKVDWRINGVVSGQGIYSTASDLATVSGALQTSINSKADTSHTHTTFDYGVILTSSGNYNGEIMTVVVDDTNASFGKVLSQGADFHYDLADADSSTTSPAYVMALQTSSGTKTVLVRGQICNTDWNWSAGKVYLSTVAGSMIQTVVSGTTDQVQVLGWALSADTIMFSPTYMVVGVV